MDIQEQKAQGKREGEDDLLNFDLDDLSLEDIDQEASGSEEDVIELTDLIEKGAVPSQGGQDEIMHLLEEEPAAEEATAIELGMDDLIVADDELAASGKGKAEEDLGIEELSMELGEEKGVPGGAEPEEEIISEADLADMLKEGEVEALEPAAKEGALSGEKILEDLVPEADLVVEGLPKPPEDVKIVEEGPLELDELAVDLLEEAKVEEPAPPSTLEMEEPKVMMEEPAEATRAPEPLPVPAPEPPVQEWKGISEEKVEAVVTGVVQEVVERVARETMGEVVERVTRETMGEVVDRVAREAIGEVVERVARETMAEVVERVARETMGGVAERVISEAIEGLKQSLESSSE